MKKKKRGKSRDGGTLQSSPFRAVVDRPPGPSDFLHVIYSKLLCGFALGNLQVLIRLSLFALLVSGWGPIAVGQPAGTFRATDSMATARRWGFTATLLKDGRVLIIGGFDGQAVVASAELYDPATERFSSTGAMSCPRSSHTATRLTDGQVLIAGGSNGCDPSAELYNPSTGTFTPTGSMVDGNQGAHSATLLKDGKVLISGGVLYPSGVGQTAPSLYDPATGMFTPAGDLNGTRYASTATLLDDGRALLVGGWRNGDVSVYDPVSGNWMFLGNLPIWSHTSTLLSNGNVLIIGGLFFSGSDSYNDYGVETLSTSEIYDPHASLFRTTGSLLQARDGHTATLLPSGRVLVAGGDWNYSRTLASAELYDPVTGSFAVADGMTVNRRQAMPDGRSYSPGAMTSDRGTLCPASIGSLATGIDRYENCCRNRQPQLLAVGLVLAIPAGIQRRAPWIRRGGHDKPRRDGADNRGRR